MCPVFQAEDWHMALKIIDVNFAKKIGCPFETTYFYLFKCI